MRPTKQNERQRLASLFAALVLILVATARAKAGDPVPEKWVDPALKATRGLALWFDATRINASREAAGQKPLRSGERLDTWYDGSGHDHNLTQAVAQRQPTLRVTEGFQAVRFDGVASYLESVQDRVAFTNVTIFIAAAPFANPGDFHAFLAMSAANANDYVTGLTIDQGPAATGRFEVLNVEGRGFGGARNLLRLGQDFGTLPRLCITSTVGPGGTKLFLNGQAAGQRDRAAGTLLMEKLIVGARYYTNGGLPAVRGFLDGDIAEILVYDRVLSDSERASVDRYLAVKHGTARRIVPTPPPSIGKFRLAAADAPPVQMLVPGFTVKQLPVDLTNINNVQYRADGKLVALAYDGNIYLLSDTDGDGLEDRAELFWENKGRLRAPIGMDLTPPGYRLGQGVFVASKGKCSLIVDTNGDGKADKEIIIARGWQELPHGVDALGVAFDRRDGSVYFGLGCADFTNAYQVTQDAKSHYQLTSERGTILRVAPDFQSRAIVATGIRFSVGMRFNRAGDLFCTDQEGATWLPNGNPLDELLHIQKGRHYGFPPRHPRYLPNVIDEPSVFDYAPQHQSTCGLNFNEPLNGGPVFGPAWWHSDALIAGYSRGKLYRTKLVKTAAGYVAQNQLLACLNMLAVDACVSPHGDLVIAVHSGGPDWGSGPLGKGKLYKVFYTGKEFPQPVVVWAQSPRELCIAFDRPIPAADVRTIAAKIHLEAGRYASPGDRFEHLRPGYQVVQDQLRTPRHDVAVHGVQITGDRRILIVETAPMRQAVRYAVTLPGLGRKPSGPGELRQVPETDLGFELSGVETTWQSTDGGKSWRGWLPHLDSTVSRSLTFGSAQHDELWRDVRKAGALMLRTKLNLVDMLRPGVQPGSKITYTWPPEQVTLVLSSRAAMDVRTSVGQVTTTKGSDGVNVATVTFPLKLKVPIDLELGLRTGDTEPDVAVAYHTNEDPRTRALPLHRMLLPWTTAAEDDAPLVKQPIPELQGGNWERGRQVFFSEEAACFKCHAFAGKGGAIGPDLSNLPQRDYHSVVRDIAEPSFAINPDFITQVVALKDGRVLTGTVRTQSDKLLIGDTKGNTTIIRRDEVEEIASSPKSIMPEGLPKLLGPERMRDLLVFLLTEPLHMPEYGKGTPPPPRSMTEVKAVLAGAPVEMKTKPIHIVLVAGKKDHGLGEHDYPAWQKVWSRLLAMASKMKVSVADEWPSAVDFKTADVLVFYQHGKWTPERRRDIDAFLARGGGLVYIHWAVDGTPDSPGFAQRIGLAWQNGQGKFRHGPLTLDFQPGKSHPIARNFDKVSFVDESYWNLLGDRSKIHLLATGPEDGKPQPLFWTTEPSRGRVFVSIPGHFAWTFDDPLFRVLLLRGIAWAAKEPVDRFNNLVTPGARVKESAHAAIKAPYLGRSH